MFQCLQVDLLAQFAGVSVAVELPESYQSQAQDHWYHSQRAFNTTQLVHDLCMILDTLRVPYQRGVPATTGLLTIDIALPDRQVCDQWPVGCPHAPHSENAVGV